MFTNLFIINQLLSGGIPIVCWLNHSSKCFQPLKLTTRPRCHASRDDFGGHASTIDYWGHTHTYYIYTHTQSYIVISYRYIYIYYHTYIYIYYHTYIYILSWFILCILLSTYMFAPSVKGVAQIHQVSSSWSPNLVSRALAVSWSNSIPPCPCDKSWWFNGPGDIMGHTYLFTYVYRSIDR